MPCGIYCIENLVNGKKYIGSSDDIEERWYYHKNKLRRKVHENTHLQNSWTKYKEENFKFYVIELCKINKLEEREDFYIEYYKVTERDYGYNKKWAFGRKIKGKKRKSRPMLQEIKEKLSKALKGRAKTEEWKEKVRKPKTKEWREKIGKSHLFKKLNVNRTSKYIGVYRNKNNRWIAHIRINGIRKYIGIFSKEIDAAKAFDIEYCKIYKCENGINFPSNNK